MSNQYGKYYQMYKKQLNSPMKESLLGFCYWLIERLMKYEATEAAEVPRGK